MISPESSCAAPVAGGLAPAAVAASAKPAAHAGASAESARAFLGAHCGFSSLPAALLHNLSYAECRERELADGEGVITSEPAGAIAVDTVPYTGRSPKDKYFVRHAGSESERSIEWGSVNQPMEPATFEQLRAATGAHLQQLPRVYVYDGYAGVGEHRLRVRIVTELCYHHHFCKNMFVPLSIDGDEAAAAATFVPDFVLVNCPSLHNGRYREMNLCSDVFIAFDLERGLGLIGGTKYAGEIKKGVFSLMHYYLPMHAAGGGQVLSLHCSATRGENDTILMAGLSGTGKSTLSADPHRRLIGDDEHGWDAHGVFNFEHGCYAKVINLDKNDEPEVYAAVRDDSILENVVLKRGASQPHGEAAGAVDFCDGGKTENTRVSYPITHIRDHEPTLRGPHPHAIVFLTCDAFGVLPPVARLSPEQAMYWFTLGYTSKIPGTERGVTTVQTTFSTCYGAAFLPLPSHVYAQMLASKMKQHRCKAYLVNTGWAGGSAADGAKRMPIKTSRAIIDAIVSGAVEGERGADGYREADSVFGLRVPKHVDGVRDEMLDPRTSWSDVAKYERQARELAEMMKRHFEERGYDGRLKVGGPL